MQFSLETENGRTASSWGGRIFLTIFGLIFAGVALGFIGFIAREAMQDREVRRWTPIPAQVISSAVLPATGSDSTHGFAISYSYQLDGRSFTGTQLRRQPVAETDVSEIERLVSRYPAGAQVTCRVNPANPAESVIETSGGLKWLGVLFVLPFLAIGVGVIVLAWWPGKLKQAKPASLSSAAVKERPGCLVAFFAVFAVIGGAVLTFTFIIPVIRVARAADWPAVNCVVESSQVRSHRSDDGTTYSVDILYRYEVDGRVLRANRYAFLGGSSSGRSGKEDMVRLYPPGRETVCYVNPADPTDTVLVRQFTPGMWLGLIPLVFVVIGVGGMIFAGRKARMLKRRPSQPSLSGTKPGMTGALAAAGQITAERVLKSRHGPLTRFLGGVAVAVFWNGITSVFVWQVIEGFRRDRPEWFLAIFIIPFVLIGLAMLGYVLYSFFGLFNPRPTLRLRPGNPRLGQTLDCEWQFSGAVGRIRRLVIEIDGVEESKYRRGTRTYTDKSVFARLPVLETDHPSKIRQGGLSSLVPSHFAPSFKGANNRIFWVIRLRGEIARWPDVSEEYELDMLPIEAEIRPRHDSGRRAESRRAGETLDQGGVLELELHEGSRVYHPRDRLVGSARWRLARGSEKLSVRLFWFTRGKGGTDAVVVAEKPLASSAAGEDRFDFELPVDHPPTLDGALISVSWA
ncbi:MAG TPA: hypothetical protein DCY13_15820, partial [Verrucomicrobiales bacterium]|nr:hypothetical protein [Verrucomicrobiales bacterium]